nr:hypothetical protein [Lachnospiraceae bacterium]
VQSAMKAIGGAASVVGGVFPAAYGVMAAAGIVCTVVSTIYGFYKDMDNQDKAIDDYIGMDFIYQECMKLPAEVRKELYGETDSQIRDSLRKEALSTLKFSSYKDLFAHLTTKYATMIYNMIFYTKDGKKITRKDVAQDSEGNFHITNKDLDAMESADLNSLMKLVPGKVFNFPADESGNGTPSIPAIVQRIMEG